MLVSQILKGKPAMGVMTLKLGTKVRAAAELLSEKRIGTIVISDDGKTPLGILSERDIVRELGKRGADCLSEVVDDLMTRKLITCGKGDDADKILQTMTDGRFRHMPVMDGAEMIGLISLGDVVKARLSEVSMEKNALQSMIMGH